MHTLAIATHVHTTSPRYTARQEEELADSFRAAEHVLLACVHHMDHAWCGQSGWSGHPQTLEQLLRVAMSTSRIQHLQCKVLTPISFMIGPPAEIAEGLRAKPPTEAKVMVKMINLQSGNLQHGDFLTERVEQAEAFASCALCMEMATGGGRLARNLMIFSGCDGLSTAHLLM